MQKTSTCIIACKALKDELDLVMKELNCALPVVWIDSGAHARPENLRVLIQEAIDAQGEEITTVLLLFGFCGNAMVGITPGKRTLILPKVADCIPLYIGSRAERDAYGTRTYFFTKGYLDTCTSILTESERVLEKYGEEDGLDIMQMMIGHYREFDVIDTGAFHVGEVADKVKNFAAQFNIPVKVIQGKLSLIKALVSRQWPEKNFLRVPPGGAVTFEDSLEAGESGQLAGNS